MMKKHSKKEQIQIRSLKRNLEICLNSKSEFVLFFEKNFIIKINSLYLETRENSRYNYEITKTLTPPKEMRESNSYGSDIDCFCLRWEKNDPSIAAGKFKSQVLKIQNMNLIL